MRQCLPCQRAAAQRGQGSRGGSPGPGAPAGEAKRGARPRWPPRPGYGNYEETKRLGWAGGLARLRALIQSG